MSTEARCLTVACSGPRPGTQPSRGPRPGSGRPKLVG